MLFILRHHSRVPTVSRFGTISPGVPRKLGCREQAALSRRSPVSGEDVAAFYVCRTYEDDTPLVFQDSPHAPPGRMWWGFQRRRNNDIVLVLLRRFPRFPPYCGVNSFHSFFFCPAGPVYLPYNHFRLQDRSDTNSSKPPVKG